jgi:hypothetical protein
MTLYKFVNNWSLTPQDVAVFTKRGIRAGETTMLFTLEAQTLLGPAYKRQSIFLRITAALGNVPDDSLHSSCPARGK